MEAKQKSVQATNRQSRNAMPCQRAEYQRAGKMLSQSSNGTTRSSATNKSRWNLTPKPRKMSIHETEWGPNLKKSRTRRSKKAAKRQSNWNIGTTERA